MLDKRTWATSEVPQLLSRGLYLDLSRLIERRQW